MVHREIEGPFFGYGRSALELLQEGFETGYLVWEGSGGSVSIVLAGGY